MNGFLRSFATPLSLVTFAGAGITGILLFLGVRGGELGDIHEWLGILCVFALFMHLARNWRGVQAMFSSRTAKMVVGGVGLVVALLIATSLPFGGGEGRGGHGGGPWMVANRVADVPIATAAPALGLTGEQAVAKLRSSGVPVEGPQETLAAIARDHQMPLPRLFGVLLSDREEEG